jgi:hypothetical protein
MCLVAFLSLPCSSAQAEPSMPSSLPCSADSPAKAPDTHVFFSDENLEQLALRLSTGLYADPAVYTRLVRDIGAIRALNPHLKSVPYRSDRNLRVLRVTFEPTYFWRARLHLYSDWDCINRFLGAQIAMHPEFDYAELTIRGLYNPQIVENAYRHLPGVTATEFASLLGDGPNIYVSRSDEAWHYVFDLASGDCPAGCTEHELHYFAITPGGLVQITAIWKPQHDESPPEWTPTYYRTYR